MADNFEKNSQGIPTPADVLNVTKPKVLEDLNQAKLADIALVYGLSNCRWTDTDAFVNEPDQETQKKIEDYLINVKPELRFGVAVKVASDSFADQLTTIIWDAYKPEVSDNLRQKTIAWLIEGVSDGKRDLSATIKDIANVSGRAAEGSSFLTSEDLKKIADAIKEKVEPAAEKDAAIKRDWDKLQGDIIASEAIDL